MHKALQSEAVTCATTTDFGAGGFADSPKATCGRGIITLALGASCYAEMAKDLGLSLRLHCEQIPRAIVTDSKDAALHELFDFVIPPNSELGDAFVQKYWIHYYTPFAETLFIDCDSLVVRNLEFVWSMFGEQDFTYLGRTLFEGTWSGVCVAELLRRMQLEWFPALNTGLLHFKSGSAAGRIFQLARQMHDEQMHFGFPDTRSDEPGFALALAREGIPPAQDYGRTMRTPCGIQGPFSIDVLRGTCEFLKHGERVRPAIAHFAPWKDSPTYWRERTKLRMYRGNRWQRVLQPFASRSVYLMRRLRQLVAEGNLTDRIVSRLTGRR